MNEPVLELDLAGNITFLTQAAREWTQRDVGQLLVEAISPQNHVRFLQTIKRVGEGKTTAAQIEVLLDSGDNPALTVELKISAIAREGGKPSSLAVWVRDLSIEKANETAANVQGTHLLDLVENVSDACVVEGADGTVVMVNDAFCNLFFVEAASQSLVGTMCSHLFETASANAQNHGGPLYFSLDNIEANQSRASLVFALANGEPISQTTLSVEDETGIAGRLHVFRPQTRRDVAEDATTTPSAMASTAQMQQIETIARELVVTLESAGSAIHRAEQLDLPVQIFSHFKRVEASASNAFESVASLLDFSRIEGGTVELELGEFRLREAISSMIERVVPHAESRNTALRVRVEQDVPETLIGDGGRVMLALRNLIDCGLAPILLAGIGDDIGVDGEASHGGSVALSIAPEYVAENIIHLAFSVEHTLAKGSVKTKMTSPTSMMQLALARQIVRALGNNVGKLEIIERKNGTAYEFTAAFPFSSVKEPVHRPRFMTLTALPALIVSSDQAERKTLSDLMRSWRMNPREADNATMALQLLARMAAENNPVHLVITSNQLPVQDGFLLAFRIKNHHKLKSTSVMMLANSGKPGDAITCRENGISAYLRQPLAPQQLNEAIAAVMGTLDANATATLITRHSLRESKKGSVLIIDANRDQAMFAAGGLKKRDYRVVVVTTASEAYEAMVQEEFDVVVVDPVEAEFEYHGGAADSIRQHVGQDRIQPKILFASESPTIGPTPYDGMVLKPYAKDSLVNAIADILPGDADTVLPGE